MHKEATDRSSCGANDTRREASVVIQWKTRTVILDTLRILFQYFPPESSQSLSVNYHLRHITLHPHKTSVLSPTEMRQLG
jgi:hypothetical protein